MASSLPSSLLNAALKADLRTESRASRRWTTSAGTSPAPPVLPAPPWRLAPRYKKALFVFLPPYPVCTLKFNYLVYIFCMFWLFQTTDSPFYIPPTPNYTWVFCLLRPCWQKNKKAETVLSSAVWRHPSTEFFPVPPNYSGTRQNLKKERIEPPGTSLPGSLTFLGFPDCRPSRN